MQKRKKRTLFTVCLAIALGVLCACGTDGEEEVSPSLTPTEAVIPDQMGAEGNVTATPEATVTPMPTETPTPDPTHAPAKNEGIEIPAEYRKLKKDASGTVVEITYTTKDYYGTGEEMTKPAYVYLPYGYDEEKQYNVLFLMHSGGGDETEWGLHKEFSSAKLVLDNLIYYGDIEPMIVVAANGRTGVHVANLGLYNFLQLIFE